ncbi:PQQ-like domain-containing protein [Pedococcus cremeus]|uniref:PQQ-like domain-containing protein n=1 Tax=Pedococcus cremeus TaxID=587636 RepID=A0A1H9RGY4_9MICO|nr:PQQ-binding-like beta-propeller repeat protein [Pedococcus cremeus]SER71928.1 PQQ-like domain-containing protein [Pedococcus cremeus]
MWGVRWCGVRWGVGVAVVSALLLSGCVGNECDFDPCPPGKGWVSAVDAKGTERWRTEVADRSDTAPLVTGDHVVVTGCKGVHVLDAATGRVVLSTKELEDAVGVAGGKVWGRGAAHPGRDVRGVTLDRGPGGQIIGQDSGGNGEAGDFGRTVAVSGDRLVGSRGDILSVYPASGGPDQWIQLPVRPTTRFVPVGEDRAVTASRDGSVLGVDLAGPRLVWRLVTQQVATSFDVHIEVAGDTVVASASGLAAADGSASPPGQNPIGRVDEVFAARAADGHLLWRRPGASLSSMGDGVAVLSADRGTLVVVDLTNGRELWSLASGSTTAGRLGLATVLGPPSTRVVADGTVALSGSDLQGSQVTVGVDARTGRERWRLEGLRRPVALDGVFGVDTWDPMTAKSSASHLGVLDARTGRQRWQVELRAEHFGADAPETHLVADPRRAQTVVADLPSMPHGGCY